MKTWKILLVCILAAGTFLSPTGAFAVQVFANSYDMINGTTSSVNLRDDTYTGGTGPVGDYTPLSGGKGDLTDGILATGVWWQGQAAADPFVGWQDYFVPNPTITFHFDDLITFSQISVRMVKQYRPGSVDITIGNNPLQHFAAFDTWGTVDWEFIDFQISNLAGNTVVVKLNDNPTAWNTDWIMIDEVRFYGTGNSSNVPEPATMLLLGLGLIGLAGARRFRN